MRWLALVLVLVSIAIYYLPDFVGPSGGMANVASGSLPRVASLKSPGPADSGVGPGAPADESEMSCARLGWIETAERARSLVDSQPLAEEAGFECWVDLNKLEELSGGGSGGASPGTRGESIFDTQEYGYDGQAQGGNTWRQVM